MVIAMKCKTCGTPLLSSKQKKQLEQISAEEFQVAQRELAKWERRVRSRDHKVYKCPDCKAAMER